MNAKQKIILWAGISLILILVVYPPYYYKKPAPDSPQLSIGHRYIFKPAFYHIGTEYGNEEMRWLRYDRICLDYIRLLIESVLISTITGGGLYVFKDTKPK